MHQDHPLPHDDGRYLDVLVHLDDTCHDNGEIRLLAGSHKQGPLPHIVGTEEEPSSPHLPTDRYKLADSVAVPAKRGDVVVFSYYTVHGSYINGTDRTRRMVRVGYRHPHNARATQEHGSANLMVAGYRRTPRRGAAVELIRRRQRGNAATAATRQRMPIDRRLRLNSVCGQ